MGYVSRIGELLDGNQSGRTQGRLGSDLRFLSFYRTQEEDADSGHRDRKDSPSTFTFSQTHSPPSQKSKSRMISIAIYRDAGNMTTFFKRSDSGTDLTTKT